VQPSVRWNLPAQSRIKSSERTYLRVQRAGRVPVDRSSPNGASPWGVRSAILRGVQELERAPKRNSTAEPASKPSVPGVFTLHIRGKVQQLMPMGVSAGRRQLCLTGIAIFCKVLPPTSTKTRFSAKGKRPSTWTYRWRRCDADDMRAPGHDSSDSEKSVTAAPGWTSLPPPINARKRSQTTTIKLLGAVCNQHGLRTARRRRDHGTQW
jgi:hypothetical protein